MSSMSQGNIHTTHNRARLIFIGKNPRITNSNVLKGNRKKGQTLRASESTGKIVLGCKTLLKNRLRAMISNEMEIGAIGDLRAPGVPIQRRSRKGPVKTVSPCGLHR